MAISDGEICRCGRFDWVLTGRFLVSMKVPRSTNGLIRYNSDTIKYINTYTLLLRKYTYFFGTSYESMVSLLPLSDVASPGQRSCLRSSMHRFHALLGHVGHRAS
jgi:hypothetical protein